MDKVIINILNKLRIKNPTAYDLIISNIIEVAKVNGVLINDTDGDNDTNETTEHPVDPPPHS